jgi:DNA-directed RNA polymerase sigma subunit (sigma70/sigma32)
MFGEEPTNEELADIVGVSVKRIEGAITADVSICSIDEKVNEDSKTTFEDMLIETLDDTNETPEDMDEAVVDLNTLISKLNDKDQFLLKHSYGIGCQAVTIDILAQETGMSQRCIRGRLYSIYQHLHEVLKDKQYDF